MRMLKLVVSFLHRIQWQIAETHQSFLNIVRQFISLETTLEKRLPGNLTIFSIYYLINTCIGIPTEFHNDL